jgi:tropomyosin, fungi type
MASGAQSKIMQKMNSLRLEADENAAKAEELKQKVKDLEQDNLTKEQEITSLTHRNQLLESEVEKLENTHKDLKKENEGSASQAAQHDSLTRRVQVLEDENEKADQTLRETNEKYVEARSAYRAYTDCTQAASNRCQGRPLRAQGPGPRV